MTPVPMATMASMAVLSDRTSVMTSRRANASTKPIVTTKIIEPPAMQSDPDGWHQPVAHHCSLLPRMPRRPDDEDDDEDGEGDDVPQLVRAGNAVAGEEQVRPDLLEDAEHEAAEHRADDVADAAEHGRREGLDAGDEAHREEDLAEDERVEDAGRAGQRRRRWRRCARSWDRR